MEPARRSCRGTARARPPLTARTGASTAGRAATRPCQSAPQSAPQMVSHSRPVTRRHCEPAGTDTRTDCQPRWCNIVPAAAPAAAAGRGSGVCKHASHQGCSIGSSQPAIATSSPLGSPRALMRLKIPFRDAHVFKHILRGSHSVSTRMRFVQVVFCFFLFAWSIPVHESAITFCLAWAPTFAGSHNCTY